MLVAIAPDKFAKGVESPADDWRVARGSPANCRKHEKGIGIDSPYVVTHISNALETRYQTDAHLVMYVMRDATGRPLERQPRIRKAGLPFVESLGYSLSLSVLTADVDNPNHCDWTPELRELALEENRRLETAGVYFTAHGRRIVQPLTRSIPISEAEGVLAGWIRYLEDLGLHPDWSCKDWTRHMRVPHAKVRGRVLELEQSFERMTAIDPPASAEPRRARPRAKTDRSYTATATIDAAPLAKAFEDAGWLGPKLGVDKRAVLCPWRSSHSGGRDFNSSTVLFAPSALYPLGFWWCSHGHCAHRTQDDVIAALPASIRASLPKPERTAPSPAARNLIAREKAQPLLEDAFRRAPDGLSVVVAGCGVGKTRAALAIAAERSSARARKLFSKTAISVPTHQLALELVDRLRADGVPAVRFFGPLAHKQPDGSPTCRFHEAAGAFSRGGLSVPWEFCQGRGKTPCEHAETCPAANGMEGPEHARVGIGPHALMAQIGEWAGKTGLLVIDEPPALLEHQVLTPEQLRETSRALERYFEFRYSAGLRPALEALADWISKGQLDAPAPLERGVLNELVDRALLEHAEAWTGAVDAVSAARAAFKPPAEGERPRPTSPAVKHEYAQSARRHVKIAAAVGDASRVAWIVWLALQEDARGRIIARLEERNGKRVLVVTLPDAELHEAILREGSCIVADANGRLHLPIYEKVVGYAPPLTEVHVGDGAEIKRVWFDMVASRTAWMPHGRLDVKRVERAVRSMVDWLLEGPDEPFAIVTLQPLEVALRAALGEDVESRLTDELAEKLPRAVLEDARRLLGPELRRLRRVPDLAHFGAIRGLDHWRRHGALVTLGDPWPQLADARWEGQFLALDDWEARLRGLVGAELEQAHGRLRTVHRTSPARALHVGSVEPSGATWERREDRGGRRMVRHAAEEIRRAVERAGSVSAASRELGLNRRTISKALAPVTPAPKREQGRIPSEGSDRCV